MPETRAVTALAGMYPASKGANRPIAARRGATASSAGVNKTGKA